jgi:monoterpene epsilon-lactone hydrolase
MSARLPPAVARLGARQLGRRVLDPALPWAVQRRRLDRLFRAAPVPRGTTVRRTIIGGVPAEVVTAGQAGPGRTVLHFHGGGYCVGSALLARGWAAQLSAQANCQVILPDYRLAPEHRYPAALHDAQQILNALAGPLSPADIVVSGDSAGGGLALALLLGLRDQDGGSALPAGCVLQSPWLDLGQDRQARPDLVRRDVLLSPGWLAACARAYTDPVNWADPAVSPLHATYRGLPPLLIQAGADELLAPDAAALAAGASAAGVDVSYTRWPGMWHDFTLQPGMLAAADSALAQAAWFVTAQLAGSGRRSG